jgi:multidrug efflux system membrane fusion protein
MAKIAVMIALMVAAAALIGGCGGEENDAGRERTIPVTVAPVEYRGFVVPVNTSGRLSVGTEMMLSFKPGGVVDGFRVDEGDRVSRGQVLASLKLAEIQAQVEMASISLNKARRDAKRAANLYADSVATLEQMQNSESAVKAAEAQLQIARFNLDHSVIKAPADGIVLKRLVEPNELVGPGTPVLFVGTTDDAWTVNTGVADRDVIRLAVGDSAEIFFDSYADTPFTGKVAEIAESPSPATGTYEVKLSLDPDGVKLLSGFSAKVTIFPRAEAPHYLVPIDALCQADGFNGSVYTVGADNRAARVRITISHILDDRIAVASGLEHIDRVITRGAAYVIDGSPVKIMNTPSTGIER